MIGAGNHAGKVLIPAFAGAGAVLHTIATTGGVSGVHFGRKYGFREITTDTGALFADSGINTAVIATRHDTHARFVAEALRAGKHVFVEKPLCLTLEELQQIVGLYEDLQSKGKAAVFMVGFNRRFSPHAMRIRALLDRVMEPKHFVMTVNAGPVPPGHWTQDPTVGGGRIIGEACHFVDLLRFLAGTPITGCDAAFLGGSSKRQANSDKASITLYFADGSVGVVHYLANGHRSFPKERLEVFCAGRVLQLDNFRKLRGYGWPGFSRMNSWVQDKGQKACVAAFVNAIRNGGPAPIPFDEIVETSRVTIEISASQYAAGSAGGR
jgi:predicted dehydrogenase